jgi:hypothetical protein
MITGVQIPKLIRRLPPGIGKSTVAGVDDVFAAGRTVVVPVLVLIIVPIIMQAEGLIKVTKRGRHIIPLIQEQNPQGHRPIWAVGLIT